MKGLERNKIPVTYRLYLGEQEQIADGLYTGERPSVYADPVTIKASVSAARGTSDVDLFGINANYTNTVIVDDLSCPIDENSRLEINGKPFAVSRVAKSLNHITYAVTELSEPGAL
jgi:hypothetical protein